MVKKLLQSKELIVLVLVGLLFAGALYYASRTEVQQLGELVDERISAHNALGAHVPMDVRADTLEALLDSMRLAMEEHETRLQRLEIP